MTQKRCSQTVLVGVTTPWDERERFMADIFRAEVRSALEAGFRDVYIFGTAGEGYAVDTARFREVVSVFREATDQPNVHAQVGIIALSTANSVERIGAAFDAGFRVFQISLPSWGALNDSEVMRFFCDVCGSFPDAQFLHYNLDRPKRRLHAGDYRRVVDQVPNLVAAKITGRDVEGAAKLVREVPELQFFFAEHLFGPVCRHGECSLLAAYAPLIPRHLWQLLELAQQGRFDEAEALARRIDAFGKAIFAGVDGRVLIDGAYDKVVTRLAGHATPLRLLSPYESMTEAEYAQCERALRSLSPEWNRA